MVIIRLTYRMVFLADVFQLTEEQCLSIQAILKTLKKDEEAFDKMETMEEWKEEEMKNA